MSYLNRYLPNKKKHYANETTSINIQPITQLNRETEEYDLISMYHEIDHLFFKIIDSTDAPEGIRKAKNFNLQISGTFTNVKEVPTAEALLNPPADDKKSTNKFLYYKLYYISSNKQYNSQSYTSYFSSQPFTCDESDVILEGIFVSGKSVTQSTRLARNLRKNDIIYLQFYSPSTDKSIYDPNISITVNYSIKF